MRIDSSFQPDQSCIAFTVARRASVGGFHECRRRLLNLHFRGAAIIWCRCNGERRDSSGEPSEEAGQKRTELYIFLIAIPVAVLDAFRGFGHLGRRVRRRHVNHVSRSKKRTEIPRHLIGRPLAQTGGDHPHVDPVVRQIPKTSTDFADQTASAPVRAGVVPSSDRPCRSEEVPDLWSQG
jgi:hypothetical protein